MSKKRSEKREVLNVVTRNDRILGTAPIEDIYKKKLTHRIVHVFLFNPENSKIFLQQRSMTKSFLPGYYCTSAGGHVRVGEKQKQAAKRELSEELGVTCDINFVDKFSYESDNHTRLISLFVAKTNQTLNFVDGEVMGGKFFSKNEVSKLISKNRKIHPQLKVCFDRLVSKQLVDV